jgi:hypothetical protein
MKESDDYKRGWYDGYQAGQKDSTRNNITYPAIPVTPSIRASNRCNTCGIDFGDKTWGYVCNHPNCPSKITAHVSYTIGGAGGGGAIGGAGMSNSFPPGANGPAGGMNGDY